ncbi:MAG: glycosyltransferase involved in cell wall biosynthesis [Halocynthiibacter sp.]|jgi:glycosyltransferase involved in cell wall biosynthesis
MKNIRILHIIGSVDQRDGGPIENARIMSHILREQGDEISFLTLDPPDAPCLKSFDFPVTAAGPNPGKFGHSTAFQSSLRTLAKTHDVAIVHGLWNYATASCARVFGRENLPYVVFTHGMLDPWFAQEFPIKNAAKQVYWSLFQGPVLSHAHRVLFTCEEEMRLTKGAFWGHDYRPKVVAFGAQSQAPLKADPKDAMRKLIGALDGRRYLLFLSRIHPKKACDNLIKAFAEVADEAQDIDLVMAGPDPTNWRPELETLAANLGVASRIHWPGMLTGAQKRQAFAQADAFVLPSHQENFGIVVAEALSADCPVLISTKVNIWREIISEGAGMVCEDTPQSTAQMLRGFLKLSQQKRAEMRAATLPCYAKHFSVDAAAVDLRNALCSAIAEVDAPIRKIQDA